jgi:hypothetical protein
MVNDKNQQHNNNNSNKEATEEVLKAQCALWNHDFFAILVGAEQWMQISTGLLLLSVPALFSVYYLLSMK